MSLAGPPLGHRNVSLRPNAKTGYYDTDLGPSPSANRPEDNDLETLIAFETSSAGRTPHGSRDLLNRGSDAHNGYQRER